MRALPLYFFLSGLTDILGVAFRAQNVYIYWVFTIFEALFFCQFFLQLLPSRSSKAWVRGLAGLFSVGVTLFVFWVPTGWLLTITILFESMIIVHQCGIYYLTEGLNSSVKYPPKRDPGLWMVTGILFYFLVQLPVIWYTAAFEVAHNEEMALVVYSLNNYASVISSTIYIKAMTCLVIRS